MGWDHQQQIQAKEYVCGFCSKHVASNRGYWENHAHDKIYICPSCNQPTFFRWEDGAQIPDIKHGDEVKHLPANIEFFYEEARKCFSVACYTSATLICRKLLMNIAVTEGAKEGETFIWYVNFLTDKGYVPPNGKAWVDHIRQKGNEATYEIHMIPKEDTEELLTFTGMLLKFIYEFPARINGKLQS